MAPRPGRAGLAPAAFSGNISRAAELGCEADRCVTTVVAKETSMRMPRAFSLVSLCSTVALTSLAHGQGIETPAPSPHAKVEQRVGLTDVTVDYSSPAVKSRKIWGDLVPFHNPWRTGANSATKLIVSKDFTFGGSPVKAGTYSLYTVPGKTSWTVFLGSNADVWGTEVADKEKVVAQTTVKPTALAQPRERMIFAFSDTTEAGTNLDLEWEKLRVRVPITVDTKAQVTASIEKTLADSWRP